MRERFDEINLQVKTLQLLKQANEIMSEYRAMGYVVSLRQLFYQFVARGLMANTYNNYKKLGDNLVTGRNCGVIDWDLMEDRIRNLDTPFAARHSAHMMELACEWYQENPWLEQENRVEVWVEKDAVAGVVGPVCAQLRTPHLAARGYGSVSELYEAGKRFEQYITQGQRPVVLYLGDHDPSGINMADDLRKRLSKYAREPIEVKRIALTWDQVHEFNPPPNTAKDKDSRTPAYIAEFGTDECWELDALNPQDMAQLVDREIRDLIEPEAWDRCMAREAEERAKLERAWDHWERVVKYLDPNKRKGKRK